MNVPLSLYAKEIKRHFPQIEARIFFFFYFSVINGCKLKLYLKMSKRETTSLISDQRSTMPVELGQTIINHRELCYVCVCCSRTDYIHFVEILNKEEKK